MKKKQKSWFDKMIDATFKKLPLPFALIVVIYIVCLSIPFIIIYYFLKLLCGVFSSISFGAEQNKLIKQKNEVNKLKVFLAYLLKAIALLQSIMIMFSLVLGNVPLLLFSFILAIGLNSLSNRILWIGNKKSLFNIDARIKSSLNGCSIDDLMEHIDNLTVTRSKINAGTIFEEIVCEMLRIYKFSNVRKTSASGDYGIDVLGEYDGKLFGIQCKCYRSNVGNKAVQEAYAGGAVYGCDIIAVLTNRYFTDSARETADATGVELWDRDLLIDRLEKLEPYKMQKMIRLCQSAPKYNYS